MHTRLNPSSLFAFLTIIGWSCFSNPLSAQVEFKLELGADGKTYTVMARSAIDLLPPVDHVLTKGRISMVVPADGLEVIGLQAHIGQWEQSHLFEEPAENPGADYVVFQLVGTATDGAFPIGEEVPLFSFRNELGCTGKFELVDVPTDPFLNAGNDVAPAFFAEGTNGDGYAGNYDTGFADCNSYVDCSMRVQMENLIDGKYQLNLLTEDTLAIDSRLESIRIVVKVPHEFFQLHELTNLQFGSLDFMGITRIDAPFEAPEFDYIQFLLKSSDPNGFLLTPGNLLPLIQFGNGGSCSGNSLFLMDTDDAFSTPNSLGVDVGPRIKLKDNPTKGICFEGDGTATCISCAFADEIIQINEVVTADPIVCLGGMNGMVEIFAEGADDLEYSIDGGVTWSSDEYFAGLGAGTFLPTVQGQYYGCTVMTKGDLVELTPSTTFELQLDIPTTVCESDDLALQIMSPSSLPVGSEFLWTGPAGFTSAVADPVIFSISEIQGGAFSLAVNAPGCDPAFATATSTVVPEPETPTVLSNAPVCEGDTLKLSTDVEGATFEWLGPAGQSSSTLSLPGLTTASSQTSFLPGHPAYVSGEWEVRVTDQNGCVSQSGEKELLIKDRPLAFAENDGPVCLGKPANLMANPIPGANYRWRKLGETDIFSAQPMVNLQNVTSQESFVLEVELDGCFSENMAMTTVGLHPKPSAYPTFDYTQEPDCSPKDIPLTANSSGVGLTYLWAGPNGFNSQLENPTIPQATSGANGSYSLEVTNMFGCLSASPFEITGVVDALPTPHLQSSGTVCPGEDIELSVAGFDTLPATFTWMKNSSPIFGATTNTLELAAVVPYDMGLYSVEVEVGNCESESAQLFVEILESPVTGIDFSLAYPCEGSNLQFFSNSTDIVAWDWSGPNNFSSNAADPLIYSAAFAEVGTYSLTVTGTNGCTATDEVLVDGILPQPEMPEVATNSPVCPSSPIVLTVQNPVTLGTVNYEWYNGIGLPIGAGGAQMSIDSDHPFAIPPFLVRVSVNNCLSEFTNPIDIEAYPMPTASAENAGAVCPGEQVQLLAAAVPDADYIWRVSGESQAFSFEQNPLVNLTDTTTFELTIVTQNCGIEVKDSTTVSPKLAPEIVGLIGGGIFCEGSEVLLTAQNSTDIPGDLMVEYSGPNGFEYSVTAPAMGEFPLLFQEVEMDNEGVYTLVLETSEGCVSTPQSVLVEVSEMPDAPLLLVEDSLLCEGEVLELNTTLYSGTEVQYDWYFDDGNNPVLLESTVFPTYIVSDLNSSQSGVYFVEAKVDGCEPPASNLQSISVRNLPPGVEIENSSPANDPVCEGEGIDLSAPFLPDAIYEWSGPAGFAATSQSAFLPQVDQTESGIYFVEVSFPECSVTLTAETEVAIAPKPAVPVLHGATEVCESTDVSIEVMNAEQGVHFDFYYSSSNDLVETGSQPIFTLTDVIPGQSGNYHAVAFLGECRSENSIPFELSISPRESEEVFAGDEQLICDGEEVVFLTGNVPTQSEGQWISLDGGVVLDARMSSSEVQDLAPGMNRFVWSWSHPVCQQFGADTTQVLWEKIEAIPDVIFVPSLDENLEINVLENDLTQLVGEWEAQLLRPTAKGVIKMAEDGASYYSPWPNVFGEDEFVYELCSTTCPDKCDTASVRLILPGTSTASECFTPNLITPNGDGENDYFVVPCAAQWPGSSLSVFNRYGSRIYESKSYANDWDGSYDGEALPNGTYFYHLELNDEMSSTLRGYLVLNR